MSIAIREVCETSDPAIAGFGRLQNATYYAPEALIPAAAIPSLLRARTAARRNLLLVAEADGRVVGGTFFHYFAAPNTGFSSFLGVDGAFRGRGLARRLHEARFAALDRVAGAPVAGVFIDVVNPERMSADELARERAVGSDPWARRRAFARLGFRQVHVRYEQPVGGPDGGPVTTLDLLFCPRTGVEEVPTSLVTATLRAYWSPWLGEAAAQRHARELERRAGGWSQLALLVP